MAMNVEAEIRDLKRRVGEIEGSFGFLTEQIKSVHKDLLAFQARTEQRLDKLDGHAVATNGRLDKLEGRFGRVETEIRTLRRDMPGIVGDAVREAMREPRGKPRKSPEPRSQARADGVRPNGA
jgi:predicted  nucleic acid-binding Zn-ribbon protein